MSASSATEEGIDVTLNGQKIEPLVYESEVKGTGEMATYSDQCGYSESERLGPGTFTVTIEAIVFKDILNKIHDAYVSGDLVEITHPAGIASGVGLLFQDITVTQQGEHNTFVDQNGNERGVFNVQLQFKSPEVEQEQ